jgi:hypothetical protein
MILSNKLRVIKSSLELTNREIAELTCSSHTQVSRWMKHDAEPTGLQKIVLDGLYEWTENDGIGGKSVLLDLVRREGHKALVREFVCGVERDEQNASEEDSETPAYRHDWD